MTPKTQKRWIKSVIKTAQEDADALAQALPWQRGAKRAQTVAKRKTVSLRANMA